MRVVERVARVHLPGDEQGEGHDQPGERLADEGAHLVDEQQQLLHGRKPPAKMWRRIEPLSCHLHPGCWRCRKKTPSGGTGWCFSFPSVTRRQAFFGAAPGFCPK